MTINRRHFLEVAGAAAALPLLTPRTASPPSTTSTGLPSWNDGPTKRAILDFVAKTTKEGSPDFVAPPERIAVFDNDGTLWSEQPMYFQLAFALNRVQELAPKHPEWKTTQPFKGILEHDMSTAGSPTSTNGSSQATGPRCDSIEANKAAE